MTDQFTHRLIYLLGAGQSIDELHDRFIEDRYKRTMLGLSQKQRQEVCDHPEQHYPRFRERWERDWEQRVNEANKCLKQQRIEQQMIRAVLRRELKGRDVKFRISHQDEKTRITFSLSRRQEVCYTLSSPSPDTVASLAGQVISHRLHGTPLSPAARISPRSIYGVWEDPDK